MENLGLVHVYTGDGKGKTTAAIGLALRAAGQGFKVVVIQFLKGECDCGEHKFAAKYYPFEIVQFTEGNCFGLPEEQLQGDVEKAMTFAREVLTSNKYQMVILDEIFIAVRKGFLNAEDVIGLIDTKPDSIELILTGRNAPPEVVSKADLVTEMKMVRHPYSRGIKSRRGIEY